MKKKPNRTETDKKPEKHWAKPSQNRAKPEKPSQTEKTEPKPRKPSQNRKTEPNRFEPVFSLKNWTEPKPVGLTRFRFGFGFFSKKNSVWLFFLIKTEPKMITPTVSFIVFFFCFFLWLIRFLDYFVRLYIKNL